MHHPIIILDEPEIEFRYGQKLLDPHAGLALFCPYGADLESHPKNISYGVVATPEGFQAFQSFAKAIADPVVSISYGDPNKERKSKLLWPPFPGFEAAYASNLTIKPAWSREIDRDAVLAANQVTDSHERAFQVSNFFMEALRVADGRDETFGVIICVIPDDVWKNCRPKLQLKDQARSKSKRPPRGRGKKEQPKVTDIPESHKYSVDFRRQLKARAMEFKAPIQLIRESTLSLGSAEDFKRKGLTLLSDCAWNLTTTIYYKSRGKPWRLSTARERVCYVGLAFRRSELGQGQKTACCAAQMFLDTGDGVVFRGEFGPWYSPDDDEYHLDRDSATCLLTGALEEYDKLDGRPLSQVFLHSRSTIDKSEFEAYRMACPEGVDAVGVRVQRDRIGMRLYRDGKWPIIRGTLWVINERSAYLWASGFKPGVLSYDRWEVPVPLRIDIQHEQADIIQVARDILGLTKLNYNACKFLD
jgi:hypothetical protein